MATNTNTPNFAALLDRAMTEPGQLHAAYSMFHGYSLGNQILALMQCADRGIEPGPIACFNRWKELGRHVKKGQKAIELCMPVTSKRTIERLDDDGNATTEEATFRRFIFRRNWFVLSQTDGQPYTPPPLPDWNKARALEALDISEMPFDLMDGNCQGYAKARSVAVSPIAAMPGKTLSTNSATWCWSHRRGRIDRRRAHAPQPPAKCRPRPSPCCAAPRRARPARL